MTRWTWATTALLAMTIASPVRAQGHDGVIRFSVNPAETKITASVAEPMQMIRGQATGAFRVTSGEVQGSHQAVADTGRVKIVIDAASYKTDSDARDKDVTENALEAQKFPTITFESTRVTGVQKESEYFAKLSLTGRLTLHGVAKEITVPVAVRLDERNRVVADGTYTFKFEDFGVKRPSKMMGLMTTGDEATIAFHVVAEPA